MSDYNERLSEWASNEKKALEAALAIHKMWIDRSVELLMFRRVLVNQTATGILKSHQYGRQITQHEMSINDTLPIIRELADMPLLATVALLKVAAAPKRTRAGLGNR